MLLPITPPTLLLSCNIYNLNVGAATSFSSFFCCFFLMAHVCVWIMILPTLLFYVLIPPPPPPPLQSNIVSPPLSNRFKPRFPNLKPGRQLANGNHFLALFPCAETVSPSDPSGVGVGGGVGATSLRGSAAEASAIGVGGRKPGRFRRFLSSLLTCSCLSSRRGVSGGGDGGDHAGGEFTAVADPNNNAEGQQNGAYPQGALEEGVPAVAGGVGGQWQGGGGGGGSEENVVRSGLGLSDDLTGKRGGGGGGVRCRGGDVGEEERCGVSKSALAARDEKRRHRRRVGWTRIR